MTGAPDPGAGVLASWHLRPEIFLPLIVLATLYGLGWRRLADRSLHRMPRLRLACAGSGLASIAVALLSPLDALADRSFAAHMAQHMLLMMVAAPALLLADPLPIVLWALPPEVRRRLGRRLTRASVAGRAWRLATAMRLTWAAYAVILWTWHVPAAYEAALASRAVHDVEHLTFFAGALLFWWPVVHPAPRFRRRASHARRIGYVLLGAVQSAALGLLLALTPVVLYRSYAALHADALAALQDQMRGGIVMWSVGGLIDMLAVLVLVYKSLGPDASGLAIGPRARPTTTGGSPCVRISS